MIAGTSTDLRPVRAADLTLLRQWEQDPQIARLMATTATVLDARESVEQEFDRLLRTPRVKLLAIQTKEGAVIGFIRLNEIDFVARKATVRLFVAPEMQRQGYVVEGCERDAAWVEGGFVDFLHMGLLSHEWQEELA